MPIIQDEGKRMVAHTYSAESMCDGICSRCAEDIRHYEGLINTTNPNVLKVTCPVGLALGRRIEDYGIDNQLGDYIVPAAKILKRDSIGNVNPEKIKRDIRTLRGILDCSEVKVLSEANLPKITKIAHITSRITKRLPKGSIDLF